MFEGVADWDRYEVRRRKGVVSVASLKRLEDRIEDYENGAL